MKRFILLSAFVASISASTLPIKFKFSEGNPTLRGVAQCPGHEDDVLVVLGGDSPDDVCMPSTMTMNVNTLIREDLPNDLTLELKLQKLEPTPMTVPCLGGIGSCPYELCPIIDSMADSLCPHFPDGQPCGCPLLAGEFNLDGVEVPVPDMGPILGLVMEGSYEATATFYGKSNPDNVLGCLILSFSLSTC